MHPKSMLTFWPVLWALMLSCVLRPALAQPSAPKPDTWYLERSMMTLDTASHFVGSLVVSNPGSIPVYVRTSVERVAVDNVKQSPITLF